jgi:hypothetical protein
MKVLQWVTDTGVKTDVQSYLPAGRQGRQPLQRAVSVLRRGTESRQLTGSGVRSRPDWLAVLRVHLLASYKVGDSPEESAGLWTRRDPRSWRKGGQLAAVQAIPYQVYAVPRRGTAMLH